MRELQLLGILSIALFISLGSCFAYSKPTYVTDFVFPSSDDRSNRENPLWEPLANGKGSEAGNFNGQRGVWVTSDPKSVDKCRDFQFTESSGKVCMIFISYKKVSDPLDRLNKALVEDLNLPELVYSLRVVKRGRRRLVFELPSAIDALLTLNSYCKLYQERKDLTYEILNAEEY
ncbi:uncharacterized protein LOC108092334 [Drosophila ficusphila]|uniref:uncharacterized protein LOC108092334 n=1 Tax=Drosophila ficusphila TaxID=30025 RepID=UPI0007E8221C|nr:uncharacterized protein LOC108092334 [Drosophila ficusphila]